MVEEDTWLCDPPPRIPAHEPVQAQPHKPACKHPCAPCRRPSPAQELPALLQANFASQLDLGRASICGHSMGGHGAISIALKNPSKWVWD